MATDLGELLVPYMPTIRVPRTGDRVFKSECAFSFDSPVSVASCPSRAKTHARMYASAHAEHGKEGRVVVVVVLVVGGDSEAGRDACEPRRSPPVCVPVDAFPREQI